MKLTAAWINLSPFFLILFVIGCSNSNQNVLNNYPDSTGIFKEIKDEKYRVLDSIFYGINKFYFSRNEDTLFLNMHIKNKVLKGSIYLPFMNKEIVKIVKSQIYSVTDLELEKPISYNVISVNDSVFIFGVLDYKLRVISLGFCVDLKRDRMTFFKGDSANNILKDLSFENSTTILDINHGILMRSTKPYLINDKNGKESIYISFFKYSITPDGFKSLASKKIIKEVSNKCIYLDSLNCYKNFWLLTK